MWYFPVRRALLLACLALGAPGLCAAEAPDLPEIARRLLKEHPAIEAARQSVEAARAESAALSRPLYNPELELEYEDASDRIRTLGLSQTLDWSGKRKSRSRTGREGLVQARAGLEEAREALLARFLIDLSDWHAESAAARLQERRLELLREFQSLVQRAHEAGDVGRSDLDLARLALAEAEMDAAGIRSARLAAEARLKALFANPPAHWPALPALPALPAEAGDRNGLLALLDRSPLLRRALAEAAVAEARVGEAQAQRRPDPTLSLRGGRETDQRLVGLAVSIPLFVRNDFSAEVSAAQAQAARAQAERDRLRRRALARLEAATSRYRLTREALQQWRSQGQQSLQDRTRLLGRLWRTGEIGATDYLVQLQQTLDTRAAALELERKAWQAWIEWLDAAGQASAWLGLSQPRPEPDA